MDLVLEVGSKLLDALLSILVHPFYYIGILVVVLQYHRQILLERRLFHTRLHSLLEETWRGILWGLMGGALASVAMAFIGTVIRVEDVILLWIVSLILLLFRVRYLCFAYAVGMLGILHSITNFFPALKDLQAMEWLIQPIMQLHMSSLFALVAVLHLVEALLIRLQGARLASPMFYEGKRGKVIGGYHLQGLWVVPLFLVVPAASQGVSVGDFSWIPWFSGNPWAGGWTILALPVVIGFAEMTSSRLPAAKVRWSSRMLLIYGMLMIVATVGVMAWPVLTLVASVLSILAHEGLIWYSRWEELQRSPLFVHDHRGLMILAIVPKGPADAMGLAAGEIIHKVNGVKVLTKEELHQALELNSAYCKLEIINLEGHVKFVQRAIYADEHHVLGMILAPDQQAQYVVGFKHERLFSYLQANRK